jgi:hypothetical protein
MNKPLIIATKYKRSKNVISLLETNFLRPDKDIVSIEVIFYILFFLKLILLSALSFSALRKQKKDVAAIRARAFRTYCSTS